MASGGARNRSGPRPDEHSGRSEKRGYKLTALPAEGYKGRVPAFPLPKQTPRETEVWRQLWRTPQACAWSMPSEKWRWHTVAMYVRLAVRCESRDASAADLAQLHRFADRIGLSTPGLAEMGWKIATDAVGERRAVKREEQSEAKRGPARQRRLRAVGDGQ